MLLFLSRGVLSIKNLPKYASFKIFFYYLFPNHIIFYFLIGLFDWCSSSLYTFFTLSLLHPCRVFSVSEFLQWFEEHVPKIADTRPRARVYAEFATSLLQIDELLNKKAPASAFGKFFLKIGADGYMGSHPNIISLRRKYRWPQAEGVLDFGRAINTVGRKKSWKNDALLLAGLYTASSKQWSLAFLCGTTPLYRMGAFPFLKGSFHTFTFSRHHNPNGIITPEIRQALRGIAVSRDNKELPDEEIDACFLRRALRGTDISNRAFPHL